MSVYLVVFIVLSYFVWIKCIYNRHRRTLVKSLKHLLHVSPGRELDGADIRALIVTAHPDDECMFFAPTIIRLVELNASVHLLCLSEGNYYHQGAQRKQELLNSCAVLGIPGSRVTIVDHKQTHAAFPMDVGLDKDDWRKLPDDPKTEWSVSLVSSVIVKHIRAHSFNTVLTFDGRGVSGHANHIAIHKAVSHLGSSGQVPNGTKFLLRQNGKGKVEQRGSDLFRQPRSSLLCWFDCCLLSLVTVGLLRKYISFLELPLSWLLPSCLLCTTGSQGYRQAKEAMFCHRTQLLWFRHLYIAFSRYMFVNTFQIIPQGPKNLKIY